MVAPTALLGLVAEDTLIDAHVVVIPQVILDDVVEFDAVGRPREIRLRGGGRGLSRKENLHYLVMAAPGRFVEERIAVGESCVNVRAGVDENPHHCGTAPPYHAP